MMILKIFTILNLKDGILKLKDNIIIKLPNKKLENSFKILLKIL